MANKILHIFMKKIWFQRSERSGDSDADIVILNWRRRYIGFFFWFVSDFLNDYILTKKLILVDLVNTLAVS